MGLAHHNSIIFKSKFTKICNTEVEQLLVNLARVGNLNPNPSVSDVRRHHAGRYPYTTK